MLILSTTFGFIKNIQGKGWWPLYLMGMRVLAQVFTTKIKDENKGTKIDNMQWI